MHTYKSAVIFKIFTLVSKKSKVFLFIDGSIATFVNIFTSFRLCSNSRGSFWLTIYEVTFASSSRRCSSPEQEHNIYVLY